MEWVGVFSAFVMLGVLVYVAQPWKQEFRH